MSSPTTLLPFQPASMSTAQLAAVSYLARYAGHTHTLYAYQLRQWFTWCETNGLDPLVGIQLVHEQSRETAPDSRRARLASGKVSAHVTSVKTPLRLADI